MARVLPPMVASSAIFSGHSLGEDDNPSNVFETGANEAQSPSNNIETQAQAQCPQSNHMENESNDVVPGMIFSSLDCLFVSYQEHARLKGFSVVKRTSKRAVEGDDYKYARMVCDKSRSSRANKTSKRVGCTARLNAIRRDNRSWIISKMVTEHNHEIDPTFSPLMPAHMQLNVQSSGPQNLGCLPRDCRNFVDQRRRLRLGDGDAEAIRQLFCRLQLKDGNFFYFMDLDEDGRLRNVLWIHLRCRAAYEEFHDVLSFDTTYLRNVVEVVVDERVAGVLVEAEFKVELVGVAATDMVMEWVLKEMKEQEMLHKKMKEHSYLT
ncbi:hypothetical protein ACS0TY_030211 [Phlomoides rotata]